MYTSLTVKSFVSTIREVDEGMKKGYENTLIVAAGEQGRVYLDVTEEGNQADLTGTSGTLYIYPNGTNKAYSVEVMRSGYGLDVKQLGRITAFFSRELTTKLKVSTESWYDWELWVKRPIDDVEARAGKGRLVITD